jgi:O-methyltransferase
MSSLEDRYLALIKKALIFGLWDEPGLPITAQNDSRPFFKRRAVDVVSKAFDRVGLELAFRAGRPDSDRRIGRFWPRYAHTMIGETRLDQLQWCIERALGDGVPGDLLEAGVWRGGACILMAAVLAAHGVTDRRVFVADSFRGLPPPDLETYPQDVGDRHHEREYLSVSREEVEENFRRYGLLSDQIVFLEGWFSETLPAAPVDQLAVLRVDGDMYSSTTDVLVSMYPKLAPGGFCVIDDYALPGCRQATDDFRNVNRISSELIKIDWTGVFWRKAKNP